MTTRADYHVDTANQFLAKARVYLAEADLLQASEKCWGAAARMVKAVAEERGWAADTPRHLFHVVDRLAEESCDAWLRSLFNSATSLHQNFYEDWMTEAAVCDGLDNVDEFASRLKDVLD